MDKNALLRERIAKVISEIPLDDPTLVAFHAGYMRCCTFNTLGEGFLGMNTFESVKCALGTALLQLCSVQDIPSELKPYLALPPTAEFKNLLVEACKSLEDNTLEWFGWWADTVHKLDPLNDNDLKQLVIKSLRGYAVQSVTAEVAL